MSRLTWAFVAANPKLVEIRQVLTAPVSFTCPFCEVIKSRGRLVADYRCRCGALFYNTRAMAVRLK